MFINSRKKSVFVSNQNSAFSSNKSAYMHFLSWVVSSFAALTLIVMQVSVQGASYYVAPDGNNNNSGSIAAPWKTINYAVNRTSPAQAGDTIYVRAGTYRETVNIRISGLKGKTFLVKNYPNETPIICGSDILTAWTHCQSNDAGLTVNGVVNPYYANIYWVEIDASMITDPAYLILFEDGRFAYIAQQPNQSSSVNQNINEYYDMPNTNTGQKLYVIDGLHTQSDGYWNNAEIWMHVYGNRIEKRIISDFAAAEHKLILNSPLPYNLRDRDVYTLVNHPHILDKAGEYYYYKDNVNNKYRIYFWPENTANLANNISIGVRNAAFTSNGSYVTIDGFTITMLAAPFSDTRSGGVVCAAGWNHSNLTVKNCNINNSCVRHAITVASGTNDILENNTVNNIKEGRGIYDGMSTAPIIRNNDVNNTGLTSIFFQVVDKGQIIANTVGAAGVHGNGISVYNNSSDILVARNIVLGANFAASIQATRNITFYGNIFEGGDSKTFVNNGRMTGNVYILNNIMVGNNGQNNGLYNGNTGNWVIKNNIIQGYLGGDTATEAGWGQHAHNLYTAYSWTQNPSYSFKVKHWRLNEGEYKVAEYAVFKAAGDDDYTLKIDSVAIDAGADISGIISSLQSSFPDFDFYKDIAGNPVQGIRDIGPYESSSGNHEPVIDSIADRTVQANTTLKISVGASDVDGDALTYAVSDLPGAVIDSNGVFEWTPTNVQAGQHLTTFTVYDSFSSKAVETTTITVTNQSTVANGPVLHMNFDGNNITDSSGNGNNGLWFGNASFGSGLLNDGLLLDGTSQGSYAFVKHDATLDGMENLSLSVWAQKNSPNTGGWLIHKHIAYYLKVTGNTVSGYIFNDSMKRLDFQAVSESLNNTYWHHYAVVYDGQMVRLYVDGTELSAKPFSGRVAEQPAYKLNIGKNPWGNSFDGAIDELSIYNRALTSDEVSGLFNGQQQELIFAPIDNKTVNENETLIINIELQNPNDPNVTILVEPLPQGASLDGNTFTWTPTYEQANVYDVNFIVTNDEFEDIETVTITVINQRTVSNGPTLHMNFDGNITDSSGNGNNGLWFGNASFGTGLLNDGLLLDGTSQGSYAFVKHDATLDGMENLSLSVWAQKNSPNAGGWLIHKHIAYYLKVTGNTVSGYIFNDSMKRLDFQAVSESLNNTYWHHYAVVYDGQMVRLYVDGTELSAKPFSGRVAEQPAYKLNIGKNPWGNSFDGAIDELSIYNRALTSDEVSGLFNGQR